jgi:hypothetical protein
MTWDRLLGGLGVLLGIPGVLVLFFTANVTLAVFAGVLAVLLLAAAMYGRFFVHAPPYTFNNVNVTLEFGATEKSAVLRKEYKIRPNYAHLKQLEHRNIASDGSISNICWNGVPVPGNNIIKSLGEYHVKIDLPVAPRLWSVFDGELSYDLADSFGSSSENIMYSVDSPTREAKISIKFPPNRGCKSAAARRRHGAGESALADPTFSAAKDRLEFKIVRPAMGASYIIYWDW